MKFGVSRIDVINPLVWYLDSSHKVPDGEGLRMLGTLMLMDSWRALNLDEMGENVMDCDSGHWCMVVANNFVWYATKVLIIFSKIESYIVPTWRSSHYIVCVRWRSSVCAWYTLQKHEAKRFTRIAMAQAVYLYSTKSFI